MYGQREVSDNIGFLSRMQYDLFNQGADVAGTISLQRVMQNSSLAYGLSSLATAFSQARARYSYDNGTFYRQLQGYVAVDRHEPELKNSYKQPLFSVQEAWNSDFARTMLVPDAITVSFGGSAIGLLGFSGSLNATFLTRGPEASFIPKMTLTGGWKLGYELSSGITLGKSWKVDDTNGLSPVKSITMESMLGYGVEGSGSYGVGGTVGAGLDSDNRPAWYNMAIGVGEAGGSAGVTYTMRVSDVIGILKSSFQR